MRTANFVKSNFFVSVYILIVLSFSFHSQAQTSVPGGAVSGTWTLAGSPYLIQGSIQINNGDLLTIDPGVTVNFQGTYKLNVQGRLIAVGTVTDSIVFTAANTANGWRGIRFNLTPATNDSSKIQYCKFLYGKATGGAPENNGGAFYFKSFSKANISYCRISACRASNAGAGIYCDASSPVITRNKFSNDTAVVFNGGGIFCENASSPVLTYNSFTNNSAGTYGGAICCYFGSNALISNNIISNNYAESGGGIFAWGSSPQVLNNTITYNTIFGNHGGGITFNQSSNSLCSNNIISNNSGYLGGGICIRSSSPSISNNTISYNTGFYGGGIYCQSSGSAINYNTISNCTADYGGGVFCDFTSPSFSNNTITNNKATIRGGGLHLSGCTSSITNTTISNNDASGNQGYGGAVYCISTSVPSFRNCILYGNTCALSGPQVYIADEASDPNFYYCNVQGGSAAFDLNTNIYSGTYSNNISINPNFISPTGGSGNGFNGVTANWALQSTSPCINAGDPGGTYPATDKAGNTRVVGVTIDQGAYEDQVGGLLSLTVWESKAVSCYNGNNGEATVIASGGTPGYTYSWSGSGQTTTVATGLSFGSYVVTVTDAAAATKTATVSITQPTVLTHSISAQTNVSCYNGSNGSTTIAVSGGTPGYQYLWTGTGQTTATASSLVANNYTVTITDANNCQATRTVAISEPAAITSSVTAQANLSCNAGSNGSVTISAQGGTGALSYQWLPSGGTSSTASGLSAQVYVCTIKDVNLCERNHTVTISQPTAITISVTAQANVSCNNGNDGSASILASGGTPSYSYLWGNGQTTTVATGFNAGDHTVDVSDINACVKTFTVSISEPAAITYSIASQTNVSCNGGSNGSISVAVSGGTGAYTYLWLASGQTTSTATGLSATSYLLDINDANACALTATLQVTEPPVLTFSFTSTLAVCGTADGSLTADPAGGTSPYSYSWSGGTSLQSATGLLSGNYSVTVTDNNGCMTSGSAAVGTSSFAPIPSICLVTVDSASQNNIIIWDKTGFSNAVDSFIVYREIATNNYQPIGAVSFDSLSLFVDTVRTKYFPNTGNPNSGTYRYKLALKDTCGNISPMSPYHNAIYISNSNGTFSWPQLYTIEGSSNPVSTYVLMRDDNSTGNFNAVNSVAGTQQSVSDPAYLTWQNTATWRVATLWGISCTPARLIPDADLLLSTYNTTLSNSYKGLLTSVNESEPETGINVYPNPSNGKFMVHSTRFDFQEIEIQDLAGRIIWKVSPSGMGAVGVVSVDIANQPSGIYFLKVITGEGVGVKKIVIQH